MTEAKETRAAPHDMKPHQIYITINITIIPSFRMQFHTKHKGNDTSPYITINITCNPYN